MTKNDAQMSEQQELDMKAITSGLTGLSLSFRDTSQSQPRFKLWLYAELLIFEHHKEIKQHNGRFKMRNKPSHKIGGGNLNPEEHSLEVGLFSLQQLFFLFGTKGANPARKGFLISTTTSWVYIQMREERQHYPPPNPDQEWIRWWYGLRSSWGWGGAYTHSILLIVLTDCPPPNWAGSLLPGIFGLFAVGWESFSEVDDNSSKLIRSGKTRVQYRRRVRSTAESWTPPLVNHQSVHQLGLDWSWKCVSDTEDATGYFLESAAGTLPNCCVTALSSCSLVNSCIC